jgi:hypothetical protein
MEMDMKKTIQRTNSWTYDRKRSRGERRDGKRIATGETEGKGTTAKGAATATATEILRESEISIVDLREILWKTVWASASADESQCTIVDLVVQAQVWTARTKTDCQSQSKSSYHSKPIHSP